MEHGCLFARAARHAFAVLVAALLFFAPHPARADDDYARVVDRIAELTFHIAWPTAEYDTYWCCLVRPDHGRLVVTFRLHGRSAFGGGHLWTDVNIALSKDGIEDLAFGDNNAILARPGQTMGALIDVLRQLNAQAQISAEQQPSTPPRAPLPPSPPPAPPPPGPAPVSELEAAPPPASPARYSPAAIIGALPPAVADSPAGDPGLQWFFRLAAGGGIGSEKLLSVSYPNRLGLAAVFFEGYRTFKIAGSTYLAAGFTVGAGAANGQRCLATVSCQGGTCTCPTDTAEWSGFLGRYGPSGGLVFGDKNPTGFYTLIWLPRLRAEHLFSQIQTKNGPVCEGAYGTGNCSGWSFGNVAFTGSIDFDFGHPPWGCGLRLGLGTLVGDLASREHAWLLSDIAFAYSLGF
jgi:hypothetical protein